MIDFTGQHEVYASGDSIAPDGSPLSTGDVDLGAMVVSPGQDFLLNISPGNGNTMTVAPYYTATAMMTIVGVNGFSGTVTLSQPDNSNSCFSIYAPASLAVPLQGSAVGSITIRNNCSSSTTAQLTYAATANPQGVNRLWHQAITPTFVGGTAGDFSVSVDAPSVTTLVPNGSVRYPVYVKPINGQTGTVNLTVTGTLPVGVTAQFDQPQLTLDGSNTSTAQLTLTSTTDTPGGSLPITVRAALGGTVRTASFNVGTQVTTFQVSSVTGAAIVRKDGSEVQIIHTVPANNAPNYTTCASPVPGVTCRIVSAAPGTVTIGITADSGAPIGTVPLSLNAGANWIGGGIVSIVASPSVAPSSVPAGRSSGLSISGIPPAPPCPDYGGWVPCYYFALPIVTDMLGKPVGWPAFGGGFANGGPIPLNVYPSSDAAGLYNVWVDLCDGDWALLDFCIVGPDVLTVEPPRIPAARRNSPSPLTPLV
jgi:hypothetical protein